MRRDISDRSSQTRSSRRQSKKIIMERLTNLSDAHSFNSLFWKKHKAQDRFVAMWKAVDEFYKIRGIDGYKLRLQRSVQNIKHS